MTPPRCSLVPRVLAPMLSVFALLSPLSGAADDTSLFAQGNVAPNVVFLFDNSGSMNNLVWHPAYRPDVVYDPVNCPYVANPNDPNYDPRCLEYPLCDITPSDTDLSSGTGNAWVVSSEVWYYTRNGKTATRCGNDRTIYIDPEVLTDGNSTAWTLGYLNWYFSDNVEKDHDGDGRTILEEITDLDDGISSPCIVAQGADPTYAKYRRARVTAAKQITRTVICQTNQVANIRYGLATFDDDSSDPDGGYITVPVDDYSTAQASSLESGISAVEGESWTPLAESLYNVYRYYQSRVSGDQALGKNGSTRFPAYDIRTSGYISSTSIPPSPVTHDCQKHFVVLLTDGEPTKDTFQYFSGTSQSTFQDQLIGDYLDPGDETETSNGGLYLDDVAAYMQDTDFWPTSEFPGKQTVDVYTVGFTTNAAANDLLSRTAAAGNGIFFFSNNAEELTQALSAALSDIVAKSLSFTAATVPASRATDGNNFFSSFFIPSQAGSFWEGHLKLFEYNALGEVRDMPTAAQAAAGQQGDCALDDPLAPTRCEQGRLMVELDGYWDAAEQIPPAVETSSGRKLFVSKLVSGSPQMRPFTTGEIAASDLWTTAPDPLDYTGVMPQGNNFPNTAEELADAIVRYVRGCAFDASSCTDRGDGRKLWDIFHSNPVVVGSPNAGVREVSYSAFVQKYAHRKRVIYAGSNGGFMHGFNTGEWDTSLDPDAYNRGDGVEEFGFMAYPARQNIDELPVDVWPRDYYYMDGSPTAADVWLYPGAQQHPGDATTWNEWRTALIGGMREGGRVIWALDVTNPPDSTGSGVTGGPSYPAYLWEFPCEAAACDTWRPFMGETWSQPVITRVKVTVDCDYGQTGCEAYDRWVAIFGAGYDPQGDPNNPHEPDNSLVDDPGDPLVYDGSCDDLSASGCDANTSRTGRALFMVDVTSGEVLAAKYFQHDGTSGDNVDGEPEMKYALASAPGVFDIDWDGYADVVYVGDLGGNLWKWVIHDPVRDPINGSGGSVLQPDWPFFRILQAENCLASACASAEHFKSFFFPPTGALIRSELFLALGSGERNALDYDGSTLNGGADEQKNRFYVFRDDDPLERERTQPSGARYTDAAGSNDFVDATTLSGGCTPPPLPAVGFYLEGAHGEKFVTDSSIFFGTVLTGSYEPGTAGTACSGAGGQAYLYAFDLLCGEGAFPPASSGGDPERRISIGTGLPNNPRVSVGPVSDGGGGGGGGDCSDMVVVITSEGQAFSDCPGGRPSSGVRLNSWRDTWE